jgi:uncharacterized RDD family membrane protein YckC
VAGTDEEDLVTEPSSAQQHEIATDGAVVAPTPTPPPPATAGYAVAAGGAVSHAPVSTAGKRFGAYLLDGLLASITLGIGWIIWSLVLWSKGTGQSPGKKLMGMRVISEATGQAAGFGTMAKRELLVKGILNSITFGIIFLLSVIGILGESRKGVWDKMAKTVVVDDPDGRLAPR